MTKAQLCAKTGGLGRRLLLLAGGFALTLAGVGVSPAWADAAAGKKIFEAKECGACHAASGPVATVPVAERAKIKGPPLWFAGSKFQSEWLTAWLAKPVPILRVKYGTLIEGANAHVALPASDAKEAGAYLMSLIDGEVQLGVIKKKKLTRRKMFKGEALFAKKQVCFGCHQYTSKGNDIGGFSGPSIVGAGARLQVDWVYAFLKDPLRYYPNGRMPVYGDQAFEPYTEDKLKLLVQYIGNQ